MCHFIGLYGISKQGTARISLFIVLMKYTSQVVICIYHFFIQDLLINYIYVNKHSAVCIRAIFYTSGKVPCESLKLTVGTIMKASNCL